MHNKLLPIGFFIAFACLSAMAVASSQTLWANPVFAVATDLNAMQSR